MPLAEAVALSLVLAVAACNAQLAGGATPRRALQVPRQHHYTESLKVQPSADMLVQVARQPINSKSNVISRHLHPGTPAVISQGRNQAAPAQAVRLSKILMEVQDGLLLPSEQLTESCNRLHTARHRAPVLA